MPRKLILSFFLFVVVIPSLFAAHQPEQYQTGKIVNVEQKISTEVLYYQVNTPITRDNPYFEVSIQTKDSLYLGQYTPRHSADNLPEDWKPGAEVQVRVNKRNMFVRRIEGGEIQFAIEKRTSNSVAKAPAAD